MRYEELSLVEKKIVDDILEVIDLHELFLLDKKKLGARITYFVDAVGQNGAEFVNHVYNQSIHTNPLANHDPRLWLICSFLTTTFKGKLKSLRSDKGETWNDYFELTQQVIDKNQDNLDSIARQL
jgi:hypothetical protein